MKQGARYESGPSPPFAFCAHLQQRKCHVNLPLREHVRFIKQNMSVLSSIRHRSHRPAPTNLRRSLRDSSSEPVRHVLHLWSPLSAKWTPSQFWYAHTKHPTKDGKHPTILPVSKIKVPVSAAVAKIPGEVRLPSLSHVATDSLTMIVLLATRHPPARTTEPNMEVFLLNTIVFCGNCVVCSNPLELSSYGAPHAFSRDFLLLERDIVWSFDTLNADVPTVSLPQTSASLPMPSSTLMIQ